MARIVKVEREIVNAGATPITERLSESLGQGIVMQLILQWKGRTKIPGRDNYVEHSLMASCRDGGFNQLLGNTGFSGGVTTLVIPPHSIYNFIHPFYSSIQNGDEILDTMRVPTIFANRPFAAFTNGLYIEVSGDPVFGSGIPHDLLVTCTYCHVV